MKRRRPGNFGTGAPTACVLGDLDLVATLSMAGITCTIVSPPGDPARYSRKARAIGWADPRTDQERLLKILLAHGNAEPYKPVLFYQSDQYALFVSRYRLELSTAFHVMIADHETVVALLDKLKFRTLAEQLELPVPTSCVLDPTRPSDLLADVVFPVIIKPSTRDERWKVVEPAGKAIRVDNHSGLDDVLPRLVAFGSNVLVQQVVVGPETCIESYHCYVDGTGGIAAEFTGKKLRTRPVEFGRTTALSVTVADDVADLGRRVVERIGLRGVAKLDFKRDPTHKLWLLEVNPRYTLWLHPAARAGLNIPAMVWADLTGAPRQPAAAFRPGVSWCSSWDFQAAREWGVPLSHWLRWMWRCETYSMMDLRDPLPMARLFSTRAKRGLGASRVKLSKAVGS